MDRITAFLTGTKPISREDRAAAEKAIKQLSIACNALVLKAEGLRTKYPDTVRSIKRNAEKVRFLKPDISIQSGKLEQDIAQKITTVSSCCDAVLSGGDIKQLQDQIAALEQVIRQRQMPKKEATV